MKDKPQPDYFPRKHAFQNRDSRDRHWDEDRPQRSFDRPQGGGFDRPQRSFDRPQRGGFDRPQRGGFDKPFRSFDRPKRSFDRPDRRFDNDAPPPREPRVWRQGEDGDSANRVCTDVDAWTKSRELYTGLRTALEGCVDTQFRDRILNAALQICTDIANGVERGSMGGMIRLLEDARGGCGVVRALTAIAQDLELLDEEEVTPLHETIGRIEASLGQLQSRRDG